VPNYLIRAGEVVSSHIVCFIFAFSLQVHNRQATRLFESMKKQLVHQLSSNATIAFLCYAISHRVKAVPAPENLKWLTGGLFVSPMVADIVRLCLGEAELHWRYERAKRLIEVFWTKADQDRMA
jgi:hypothetical protein